MYIRKVPIACDLSTNISTCIALHSQSYKKMLRNLVISQVYFFMILLQKI